MKHYSYDKWQQYVNDEIKLDVRIELENHLYTCDQCLELYLKAVTANETSLPNLSNPGSFTDRMMEIVPDTFNTFATGESVQMVPDTQGDTRRKKPLYQRVGFHYLLAAAATLLLMFTGAFQSLSSYVNLFDQQQVRLEEKKGPSVTEGVINKTFAWVDSLEKKGASRK